MVMDNCLDHLLGLGIVAILLVAYACSVIFLARNICRRSKFRITGDILGIVRASFPTYMAFFYLCIALFGFSS